MRSENIKNNVLEKEALLFSRYLIDREPPVELVDRYVNANRQLGIDEGPHLDDNILKFTWAHPWSISFLDAASGLMQPDALIRKKIYTMAAVLEASTLYTEKFLPGKLSALSLFWMLITNGIVSAIKIVIGVPLFFVIRRRKK
jgi:hypothetical protein